MTTLTYEQLYLDHRAWLQQWLCRRLCCAYSADDLTQDTFLKLLVKPGLPRLEQPRAYLSTIARGLLVSRWRRLEIERAYLDALASQPVPIALSAEDNTLILESLVEIDAMLDRLPYRPRAAFLMAQLEGLSYRTIAERLGVSQRMVKKYMARAMLCCLTADAGGP